MKRFFLVVLAILVSVGMSSAASLHWRKTLAELNDNATHTQSPNHPESGDRGIVFGENATSFYYFDTAWHESTVGADNAATIESLIQQSHADNSARWTTGGRI
jgi:hypothetical protein